MEKSLAWGAAIANDFADRPYPFKNCDLLTHS
jgi:hypothetical protein